VLVSLAGDQESLWGAHALLLVVAVPVSLDSRQRDAKELDNLSPGTALVYGSQHSLAQIL